VWTTLMGIYLVMNLLLQITTTVTLFAMSGVFYLVVCICLAIWHHKLWCRGSHLRSVRRYHILVFKVANATTDIFGAESNACRQIDVAVFPLRGGISWWVSTKYLWLSHPLKASVMLPHGPCKPDYRLKVFCMRGTFRSL